MESKIPRFQQKWMVWRGGCLSWWFGPTAILSYLERQVSYFFRATFTPKTSNYCLKNRATNSDFQVGFCCEMFHHSNAWFIQIGGPQSWSKSLATSRKWFLRKHHFTGRFISLTYIYHQNKKNQPFMSMYKQYKHHGNPSQWESEFIFWPIGIYACLIYRYIYICSPPSDMGSNQPWQHQPQHQHLGVSRNSPNSANSAGLGWLVRSVDKGEDLWGPMGCFIYIYIYSTYWYGLQPSLANPPRLNSSRLVQVKICEVGGKGILLPLFGEAEQVAAGISTRRNDGGTVVGKPPGWMEAVVRKPNNGKR